jgi:hypothetical protein
MTEEIAVEVRSANNVMIIDLVGDLTTFADEAVNGAYGTVTDQGAKNIIFNFRQNDYINSAGIAILISVVTEARHRDQSILNLPHGWADPVRRHLSDPGRCPDPPQQRFSPGWGFAVSVSAEPGELSVCSENSPAGPRSRLIARFIGCNLFPRVIRGFGVRPAGATPVVGRLLAAAPATAD